MHKVVSLNSKLLMIIGIINALDPRRILSVDLYFINVHTNLSVFRINRYDVLTSLYFLRSVFRL